MCSFLVSNSEDQELLLQANRLIQRRGPDYTSWSKAKGITFIHNLLSITGDFTPQPFLDKQDEIVCVYNGEIYNAFSFSKNYKSDGECIIPLYKEYGKNFAKHLDGEYAICIIDFKKNVIVLVSDTFLTKPLWYGKAGDVFAIGSYKSSILNIPTPIRMKANTCEIFDLQLNKLEEFTIKNFDLKQHKTTYDDWVLAYENSIKKRAAEHVSKKIFIGMSSGYDSGSIACELNKQNVKFKMFSVTGNENKNILNERFEIVKKNADIKYLENCNDDFLQARRHIFEYVEQYTYEIFSSRSDYTEFVQLHEDGGANAFSLVCLNAIKEDRKIYISGSGADEIFSDYGWNGQGMTKHSNFGGLFPNNLKDIWPWASFYGSSQISYLTKEEMVGGSYGIECRYPFLDFDVVQEFLWLTPELKNKHYKSVLHYYMKENGFPFKQNEKIGFYY
jgi:asparagine synthetase B (glutamine-hydrolysing)